MNLLSRFFLAEVAFTFLPLAVIAILRVSLGKFESSFFLDPEWAFAAIILYGLAMTRVLELKILYQRDSSESVFALMRLCILGLIAAVVSLALTQMNAAGLAVSQEAMLTLQFVVLFVGLMLLFLSHWEREQFAQRQIILPDNLDLVTYFNFIERDIRATRDEVDELSFRMAKRNSLSFDCSEQRTDFANVVRRQTRDIDSLLNDLDGCLKSLHTIRDSWKADDEGGEPNATVDADPVSANP